MTFGITLAHWLTLHGLVTLIAVFVYALSSHVTGQRRHPSAAIAWILFILLLPYLALPSFLAFGSRKVARPQRAAAPVPRAHPGPGAWAADTIVALGQPPPAAYGELALHEDGAAALAAFMATLDGAAATIDLCTFIIGDDGIGEAVVARLCRAAKAGVRVRLLLDRVGALMARHPDLRPLAEAGVAVDWFGPTGRWPFKGGANLRGHRKLLVADASLPGARLWCGGRNLAAEYFTGSPGKPPWRDLSFDLRGPLVAQAAAMFGRDWAASSGETRAAREMRCAPQPGLAAAGAQLVASGPDQEDDTVYAVLVTAAFQARSAILLATPYFVPDTALLMALTLAARRGVSVQLLLPAVSNHWLSDLARNRALRSLADAGGRIMLAPGMMHAKLAVFDDALALAGSANLDSRSLFLNYEMMVAFHEAADVRRFAQWFDREGAGSAPYAAGRPGLARDVAEGLLLWLGFQL